MITAHCCGEGATNLGDVPRAADQMLWAQAATRFRTVDAKTYSILSTGIPGKDVSDGKLGPSAEP